jgi:hypothetical protein
MRVLLVVDNEPQPVATVPRAGDRTDPAADAGGRTARG